MTLSSALERGCVNVCLAIQIFVFGKANRCVFLWTSAEMPKDFAGLRSVICVA